MAARRLKNYMEKKKYSFLHFNTYFKNPNSQDHDFDLHFQACVLAGGTYISDFAILENGNSKDQRPDFFPFQAATTFS